MNVIIQTETIQNHKSKNTHLNFIKEDMNSKFYENRIKSREEK